MRATMHPTSVQALQQRTQLCRRKPHHAICTEGQRNAPCSSVLAMRHSPVLSH